MSSSLSVFSKVRLMVGSENVGLRVIPNKLFCWSSPATPTFEQTINPTSKSTSGTCTIHNGAGFGVGSSRDYLRVGKALTTGINALTSHWFESHNMFGFNKDKPAWDNQQSAWHASCLFGFPSGRHSLQGPRAHATSVYNTPSSPLTVLICHVSHLHSILERLTFGCILHASVTECSTFALLSVNFQPFDLCEDAMRVLEIDWS